VDYEEICCEDGRWTKLRQNCNGNRVLVYSWLHNNTTYVRIEVGSGNGKKGKAIPVQAVEALRVAGG
jgi:hypothetical protein